MEAEPMLPSFWEFFCKNPEGGTFDDIKKRTLFGKSHSTEAIQDDLRRYVRASRLKARKTAQGIVYTITDKGRRLFQEEQAVAERHYLGAKLQSGSGDPFVLRLAYFNGSITVRQLENGLLTYWHQCLDPELKQGKTVAQVNQFILEQFMPHIYKDISWCLRNGWIMETEYQRYVITPLGRKTVEFYLGTK